MISALCFRLLLCLCFLGLTGGGITPAHSGETDLPCRMEAPYEAPPHIEAPVVPPQTTVRLTDNGDGTISQHDRGLMWVRADSYADLGQCLNFTDALEYVRNLKTGGHTDWRVPTILELAGLYDETQENVLAWDRNPDYPLALSNLFADGAAYWYWSSDCGMIAASECCAKTFYYVNGMVHLRRFELCNNGGVRAVRNTK